MHVLIENRFRKITPFGVDGIRRFKADVSNLKKLAARDYEDILQVRHMRALF